MDYVRGQIRYQTGSITVWAAHKKCALDPVILASLARAVFTGKRRKRVQPRQVRRI